MPDIEAIRTAAEELKALSEKATALPWVDVSREGFGIRSIGENGEGFIQVCDEPPSDDRPEDMAYIVAACNLAPALLALTDALTAERDELRRAIETWAAREHEITQDESANLAEMMAAVHRYAAFQDVLDLLSAPLQSAQERRDGE